MIYYRPANGSKQWVFRSVSGLLPLNVHALINILDLSYIRYLPGPNCQMTCTSTINTSSIQ